jgi:hypothetical protein
MVERIIYKNSCNISALIHLMTVHEEMTSRYLRNQNSNSESILNLLNNVITVDMSAVEHTPELIYRDGSLNTLYLNELTYGSISNIIYTSCPISRDTFTEDTEVVQIKRCGHYFKKDSIIPWLREHSCCPYCRVSIV